MPDSHDIKVQGTSYTLKVIDNADIKPCGDCRACCTVLGVREFDKPNYQPCQHECSTGCSIYPDRPASCREYFCGWKWGLIEGDERRRPDNLGVIFDFQAFPAPGVLRAWEVRPGAASEPPARYLMQKLERKYGRPVLVIDQALGQHCNARSLPDGYWEAAALAEAEATEKARASGILDGLSGGRNEPTC